MLLALAAAGCAANLPLLATPIEGGSDAARAEIRRVLDEFDLYVGRGRLTIPEVRFEPHDKLGATRKRTRRITLSEDIELDDVPWVLRHELCHALDFSEGLVEGPSALFDELAEGLFDPANGGVPLEDFRTERLRRSEALASFCALGPLGAAALAVPCDDEPATVGTVSEWHLGHVWTGADVSWLAWHPEDAPALTSERGDYDFFVASATIEPPDAIRVALDGDEEVLLDLRDGTPLDASPDDVVLFEPVWEGPRDLPADVLSDRVMGWADGPGAVSSALWLHHLGRSEPRLFIYSGASWHVAEPSCPLGGHLLFTADGVLGTAWSVDDGVRWRLLPP